MKQETREGIDTCVQGHGPVNSRGQKGGICIPVITAAVGRERSGMGLIVQEVHVPLLECDRVELHQTSRSCRNSSIRWMSFVTPVFVSLRSVVFVVQSRTVCHVEPFRQASGDSHS